MAIIMNSVPAERASIASALSAASRQIGMLIGMVLAVAVTPYGIKPDSPLGIYYARELEIAVETMRKMHRRGIRVLIGGDYGFAWTPQGTNAEGRTQPLWGWFHRHLLPRVGSGTNQPWALCHNLFEVGRAGRALCFTHILEFPGSCDYSGWWLVASRWKTVSVN